MSTTTTTLDDKTIKVEVTFNETLNFNLSEEEFMSNKDNIMKSLRRRVAEEILKEDSEYLYRASVKLNGVKLQQEELEEQGEQGKQEESPESEVILELSGNSFHSKKLAAIHFQNIPEILNSLLKKNKEKNISGVNSVVKESKKTPSGHNLIRETSESYEKEKGIFNSFNLIQNENSLHDDLQINLKHEVKSPLKGFNINFDIKSFPTLESKLEEESNSNEGHLLDLLICDNFKQSYESTLERTSLPDDNSTSCEHISKNYKVSVLFGNISYSIGLYDKSIHFYERGLNLLETEKSTDSEVIHFLHIALLQNNIARSYINCLKISEGICYLLSASENIFKIQNINNTAGKENCQSLATHIMLMKINIEFNLVESYFLIENKERSSFFLDDIFKIINNELLNYHDEKEKLKIMSRYYYNLGKYELRINEINNSLKKLSEKQRQELEPIIKEQLIKKFRKLF